MNPFSFLGKSLLLMGGFLFLLGLIFMLIASGNWKWKPLPGDIFIQRDNFTFFFPLTTSLLLSAFLTLLFLLLSLLRR